MGNYGLQKTVLLQFREGFGKRLMTPSQPGAFTDVELRVLRYAAHLIETGTGTNQEAKAASFEGLFFSEWVLKLRAFAIDISRGVHRILGRFPDH